MFFTKSCGAALRARESPVPQGPARIILCKMQHVKNKKRKWRCFQNLWMSRQSLSALSSRSCGSCDFCPGNQYRKNVAEGEIGSAEEEAKRIINESIKSAEQEARGTGGGQGGNPEGPQRVRKRDQERRPTSRSRSAVSSRRRRPWTARPTTSRRKRETLFLQASPSWRRPGKR